MKILHRKNLAQYREKQAKLQNNIDPITGKVIQRATTDHDHLTGNIRQILDASSNQFEGKVSNAYKRFIKNSGISLEEALKNLVIYLSKDYSQNPIYPGHADLMIKRFRRMNKKSQDKILKKEGIIPAKVSKLRVKQYRLWLFKKENLYE